MPRSLAVRNVTASCRKVQGREQQLRINPSSSQFTCPSATSCLATVVSMSSSHQSLFGQWWGDEFSPEKNWSQGVHREAGRLIVGTVPWKTRGQSISWGCHLEARSWWGKGLDCRKWVKFIFSSRPLPLQSPWMMLPVTLPPLHLRDTLSLPKCFCNYDVISFSQWHWVTGIDLCKQ